MRNNIDVLRAICFTQEDLESVENLGDQFSKIEIEFMVEFKKIYDMGVDQLELFINKLDEEGKDLEIWDIEYYLNHLLSGPLGVRAKELGADKKYFQKIPEILGGLGNNQTSHHNITLYSDDIYPLGVPVDTYNKSPDFIQDIITKSMKNVESVFRSSVEASVINDNTLPIVDKAPQQRYSDEKIGKWVQKSNGSYLVKDSFYRLVMVDTRSKIFDKVKEMIGEENFRLFEDRKTYNPFSDTNNSVATVYEIKKLVKQGDDERTISLDIMGDVFDDRSSVLKVDNPEKNKEYTLNTVEGQYGN
jgi:hypothetical protein